MSDRDTYSDLVATARENDFTRPRIVAAKAWFAGWGIRLIERRQATDWDPDVEISERPEKWSDLQKILAVMFMAVLTLLVVMAVGPVPFGAPTPENVTLGEVLVK